MVFESVLNGSIKLINRFSMIGKFIYNMIEEVICLEVCCLSWNWFYIVSINIIG